MSNIRATIESLASSFAYNIIEALRSASIDELLAVAGGGSGARRGRPRSEGEPVTASRRPGGRLGRRSADDIGRMIEAIATLLQKTPNGMRAEQIREALGVESKELPRPLADGIAQGRITKSGQKRATTYFAGGQGSAPKRRGRRAGGRKKR